MAKKGGGKVRQLDTVKVTAKKSNPTSVTTGGQVRTSRIDSMKKANPALGKVIGGGYKGSGGKTTYGPASSDAIKAGLKKGK